ncbi:MAG: cytochrome P450, partial [Anaerolineae bacterium]|nr:cytochrome P450 [Anaerolineae bacterium]
MLNDDITFIPHGDNGERVDQIVTQYDHVAALLRDPRMNRERDGSSTWTPPENWKPYFEMVDQWMLMRDPPHHTRLRGLVNKAFTPAAVNQLRGRIQVIANGLLDEAEQREQFDLIAEYAFELPVRVIAEMLGVPTEQRDQFKDWSNKLANALDFNDKSSVMDDATVAANEMTAFMRELIAAKRTKPTDDILTGLVQAEQDGDRLSEDEVISTCGLLLFAGHETTVNLIGNGALAFLRHPDQLALLQREPALLPNAIEEILRYESPVQATARNVSEDVQVGNATLSKGREVMIVIGAANRDPRHFTNPDHFDITRNEAKHQAFGGGIH